MPAAPRDALQTQLRRVAYLRQLDAQALTEIGRSIRTRRFRAGEIIVNEGEPCEGLYFVVSGTVRLFRTGADGREHVTGLLGPGATFNDIPVFDSGPTTDTATAIEDTVVGLIGRSAMTAVMQQHPAVAMAALQHLSARQRSMADVAEDLALRDVTARVARLLLGCAGKHRHIVENAPTACAHITHREIAAMVGSVREVVQRALKRLEQDGAVALGRTSIEVRDLDKLRQWADAELRAS